MDDQIPPPEFGPQDVEVLQREPLYDGFFRMEQLRYRHRRYRGDWSPPVDREMLYRGEAVAVLLYDPDRDLVGLVEQIRPGVLEDPAGPWCLEVVAGIVEAGESLEQVAHRELCEEAGVSGASLEYICGYYPSPGGSDERIHLYCGLVGLAGRHGQLHGLESETEDIKVLVLPAEAVLAQLYSGRFNNSPVLMTLQWLQLNRPRLQAAAATARD